MKEKKKQKPLDPLTKCLLYLFDKFPIVITFSIVKVMKSKLNSCDKSEKREGGNVKNFLKN